jgi:excisionase family DNA binding protein
MKDSERFISVEEAETITGRKAATWRRDIFKRKIAFVKFGRLVRIPMSEIERLVKEGYRAPIGNNGSNR